jgi:serine/threonine-protein kinase
MQKLGEGGMAEVFAAEPVDGGPHTAVKALRAEFLAEPLVLARFLEESRTCLRLVHPNIVRTFECGTAEDGLPFMVMELLDGVPLGAYTQNGGRIQLAQAVPILQGILAGLAAAHAQGVVHRDLKPENVFLTRGTDGTFVVKVLDFGIAKVMDEAGGMGGRTRAGMLLGTPAYMSPEQVKDPRDVDQRADLWSAGVLFYEMLTGRSAFPAPTAYARLAAVVSVEPEPVERIDPSLAPMSGFVTRALKKNREERFPSALEMARALAAAAPNIVARSEGSVGRIAAAAMALGNVTHNVTDGPALVASGKVVVPAAAPGAGRWPSSVPDPVATTPALGVELEATLRNSDALKEAVEIVSRPVAASQTSPAGETLPSKDLPVLSRPEGARRWRVSLVVVVLLVVVALGAGLLLGWTLARMT